MFKFKTMAPGTLKDGELVAESLMGNREAFAEIVSRYQTLICSMAYSATGSLGHSQDVAQETFVTAWKSLRDLREPDRLRPWLCGIARNLVNNRCRRQEREPTYAAASLECAGDMATPEPLPHEQAMSKEEEAILWRSLQSLPEHYREPLILFYREHRSVENVARSLGLSEDAVKQRLSRGRRLLHEQVLAFVEGALERTNPGKAFTLGVVAALPVLATSASAGTIAGAAVKGSATASSATLVAIVGAVLGPVIGILGAWIGVRASLNATRTSTERQFVIRSTKIVILLGLGFSLLLGAFILAATRHWATHPVLLGVIGVALPLVYTVCILVFAVRHNREFRRLRAEEVQRHPSAFESHPSVMPCQKEYRSSRTLFGLPLVHVVRGTRPGERSKPAIGWIAIGDRAYGILFAAGGLAVGLISCGGVAIGGIALGGAALGLLTLGGFAIGGIAIGGAAVGVLAAGGVAAGWTGAMGGLALAREFAIGGLAVAEQANNEAARAFFAQYPWLDMTKTGNRNLLMAFCWSPVAIFAIAQLCQRARRKKAAC